MAPRICTRAASRPAKAARWRRMKRHIKTTSQAAVSSEEHCPRTTACASSRLMAQKSRDWSYWFRVKAGAHQVGKKEVSACHQVPAWRHACRLSICQLNPTSLYMLINTLSLFIQSRYLTRSAQCAVGFSQTLRDVRYNAWHSL